MKTNIKRTMSIAIATLITVGSTGTYATSFNDITKQWAWAESYIENGKKLNLISGYVDGSFKPEKSISRIETIAMAARILNLPADETKKIRAKYQAILLANNVPDWAIDNFSVALDKGIISEDILKKIYNQNGSESLSMREEVAIYLARAIGLENEVKNKGNNVFLKFKDLSSIDELAKPYIAVMNEKGIISGDDKGNFNAKSSIRRAEMAVLLSKSHKYLEDSKGDKKKDENSTNVSGILDTLFVGGNKTYIVVTSKTGERTSYEIDSQTKINIDGQRVTLNELVKGLQVDLEVLAVSSEVGLVKRIEGNTVTEKYEGVLYDLNEYVKTLTIEENGINSRKVLTLDKDVEIMIDGKKSSILDLKVKDAIKLESRNGKIIKIDAEANIRDLKGVLKGKNITDKYITFEDASGNQSKYELHKDVKIERDGRKVTLDELKIGDDVQIHLESKKVVTIDAKKVERNVDGVIEGKNIRLDKREITIKNNKTDKSETYVISGDILITLEGKRAKLDDLHIGDYVEIKLEGEEVIEVKGQAIQLSDKHMGVISSIGVRYLELRLENGKKVDVEISNAIAKDKNGVRIELQQGNQILVTGELYGGEIRAVEILKL